MNVTLLLRMVQKIGNSLIAFSPVLTRMSVAQIYGTGFTPSLKKSMALAGLMSLASVGAYASTKSAAEGEVNTPVEALIPMAKDYVANNNIDADSSLTINNSKELAKLLSGTLSNSIEELTSEDISKKLAEKDADKIFTTFMTTNNAEQAEKNKEILNAGINTITDTYKNIQNGFKQIADFVDELIPPLEGIPKQCENISRALEEGEDIDVILSRIDSRTKAIEEVLSSYQKIIDELGNINTEYKNITNQDYTPVLQQKEQVENTKQVFENIVFDEEGLSKINKDLEEAKTARDQISTLKEQYTNLKENDIALLQMLLQQQAKFNEDGKSSAEEQAASKDLLKGLVENATPMTRNYIIKLAEQEYKPENDPTGIVDISAGALSKMYFDLTGKQLAKPREGLNIVKSAEGTVQKVIVQ